MANDTSNHSKESTLSAIRKEILARANNPTSNRGLFYIEGTIAVVPSSYDTGGDFFELMQFPANCRLVGAWVSSDTSLDSHATPTVKHDLSIADSTPTITYTLTNASTLLRTANAVISWGGSATFAENEYPGIDVSESWLCLLTDTTAATPADTATLSFGALVYLGAPIDLGAG